MRCPNCGEFDSKVIDSRPSEDGKEIKRRRECIKCEYRFTTYEKVEQPPIIVIKKNDIRQEFDKDKIVKGVLKACEKRPISLDSIENLANEIEADIRNGMLKEVSSKYIGEKIMEKLKNLDEIAYVRFASVYRQFKDIKTFTEEINKLLNK